jgi:hypothetical protein
MQNTFTYEGILRAVGRVLDESGAKGFSIYEDGDGLLIEGTNGAGEPQLHLRYRVEDIYELVTRDEAPDVKTVSVGEDGAQLRRLLAEHHRELITASR